VDAVEVGPPPEFAPMPGAEFTLPADLVLIAIGFAHPEHDSVLAELGVGIDRFGNVKAPAFATTIDGVFAAGDARRGQSLVVWAIAEGRRCARVVDRHLGGSGEARRIPAEAMFAYEDGDPHSLRHQAETAGTVTVGDAFWSGPRDER
jgi:glutamate synthase (NADPH/NADH) small chain